MKKTDRVHSSGVRYGLILALGLFCFYGGLAELWREHGWRTAFAVFIVLVGERIGRRLEDA